MATEHTHKWVVKSVTILTDTALLIFLVFFGVVHGLFNWGATWWYSLLTLYLIVFYGYMWNWRDKED